MAHDKVYVRIAEDDNFGTASIEQRPFTEAYIRKDALLEWAKERYKAIENDNQLGELVQAVEGYVCPKKDDKYVFRNEVLAKCNKLKQLLNETD